MSDTRLTNALERLCAVQTNDAGTFIDEFGTLVHLVATDRGWGFPFLEHRGDYVTKQTAAGTPYETARVQGTEIASDLSDNNMEAENVLGLPTKTTLVMDLEPVREQIECVLRESILAEDHEKVFRNWWKEANRIISHGKGICADGCWAILNMHRTDPDSIAVGLLQADTFGKVWRPTVLDAAKMLVADTIAAWEKHVAQSENGSTTPVKYNFIQSPIQSNPNTTQSAAQTAPAPQLPERIWTIQEYYQAKDFYEARGLVFNPALQAGSPAAYHVSVQEQYRHLEAEADQNKQERQRESQDGLGITSPKKQRPCQSRNSLFLQWYREIGAESPNVYGQIRDRWNALPDADRKPHIPCGGKLPKGKNGYDTVRKAVESLQSDGGNL